jgi:hypothetical protein
MKTRDGVLVAVVTRRQPGRDGSQAADCEKALQSSFELLQSRP